MGSTRRRPRHVSALALIGAVACSADGSAARWQGRVDVINADTVVWNPADPVVPPAEVSLDSLWVLTANPEPSDDRFWEDPSQVRAGAGIIYLLDRPAHLVHAITPDGLWTGSIGGEGGGPGEFQEPRAIAAMQQRLVVIDRGTSLELMTTDGQYVRSIETGKMLFGGFAHGDRLVVTALLGREGGRELWSLDGTSVRFAPGPPVLNDYDRECARFASTGTRLVAASCKVMVLELLSDDGVVRRTITVDRPVELTPAGAIDRHVAEVRRVMAESGMPADLIQQQVEQQREAVAINRKYGPVRVDAIRHIIYVREQDAEPLEPSSAALHLFTEAGVFLATLDLGVPVVDFDVTDGHLIVLRQDENTGLSELAAYEVRLPIWSVDVGELPHQ